MICIKCGKENKSDSRFCISCGEELIPEPIVKSEDTLSATLQEKSVREEIKKFVFSPLVIITVSLFTLYIISAILGARNIIYDTIDRIGNYLNIDDLEYYFQDVFGFAIDIVNDIFTAIVLVLMIPNIVICVGLWITLYSAYDKKSVTITTAGMKTIKVVNIVTIILNAMLLIPYTLRLVVGFIEELTSSFLDVSDWFILIFILGIVTLRFLYLFKINSTIKSFIQSVKAERIFMGASKFVAVMLMISGAFQCLLGLFSFATFSMWCSALSSICFALIIFKFKNLCESKLKEESM